MATLSNLSTTQAEEKKIAEAFEKTLKVIDQLQSVNVKNTPPTHQVIGLENVTREDKVTPQLTFTQEEALANASTTHEGFFVVPQVLDQGEGS